MSSNKLRKDIGRRIRSARESADHGGPYSQQRLADVLKISRNAVTQWETGVTIPELERFIQISDTLGVTTDYLLRGDTHAVAESPAAYSQRNEADPAIESIMQLPEKTRALMGKLANEILDAPRAARSNTQTRLKPRTVKKSGGSTSTASKQTQK